MKNSNITDARSDNDKIKMAKHFAEFESDYRESNKYEVVHEDDECVIVADHTGQELNEWANRFGVEREEYRATMRALAEGKMGEQEAHDVFSSADPVVFDKFEDENQ
jgi:hypothetical protein